jgi:hypothetical protein
MRLRGTMKRDDADDHCIKNSPNIEVRMIGGKIWI